MDGPKVNDEDGDLVSRILQDDREAFRDLVEKYHPRLFRLVLGIVGDWQVSEEVCQDVFVKVFTKLEAFRFRSRFSTWVYRVAVNAALKARDRAARWRREQRLDPSAPGPALEDGSQDRLEMTEVVTKLLRPLPGHLRAVVLLKEREGLTYNEIAEIIGCSRGAVEQRLHRAFVKLREIWDGRLGELGLVDGRLSTDDDAVRGDGRLSPARGKGGAAG